MFMDRFEFVKGGPERLPTRKFRTECICSH